MKQPIAITRGIHELSGLSMLSVIIITKNEEDKIRECLESVSWADEIVVVDCGSEDSTVDICQQYATHVSISDWSGFGPQKNKALKLASHRWVLSLDADEQVSAALKAEIIDVIKRDESFGAYEIPRKSRFCGRFIRHCGWQPDYVLRLFKKETARFSDDLVHEKVLTNAATNRLKNPILHFTVDTYQQAVDKMNQYSTLSAQDKFTRGKKATLLTAITHGFWTFLKTYIFRLGFLDGRAGFIISVANAEGTYYKFIKLSQLHSAANKN